MDALAAAWPEDGIAVVETPSSTAALRNRLRLSRPGSYYFSSSGGLGFGISAAVGVQLAEPSRPVVCVLGEGSAQYGITALWTAVAYKLPVTFLVLRNEEYMILKWFAEFEQASGLPGLDLPGPRRRRGGERLRRPLARGRGRRGADRGAARGDRRRGRAAARAGALRERHVAGVSVAATQAGIERIAPEPPGDWPVPRPAPDAAPDWVAQGTPPQLARRAGAARSARRASPAAPRT